MCVHDLVFYTYTCIHHAYTVHCLPVNDQFVESSPLHTLAAVDKEDSPIWPGISNQFRSQIFITMFCCKETSQRMIVRSNVPQNVAYVKERTCPVAAGAMLAEAAVIPLQ